MVVENDYDSDDSYYYDEEENEKGEPTKLQTCHLRLLLVNAGVVYYPPVKRFCHKLPLRMQGASLDLGMLTDFSAW